MVGMFGEMRYSVAMGRKRKKIPDGPRPNDNWEYVYELQIHGRNVAKGTELKISGERGRFRFIHIIKTPTTQWVDVWGGPKGAEAMRSFYLDRVKTIHYKNKTDQNLAKKYKEKQQILKSDRESQ
jgi:hypothetical protein